MSSQHLRPTQITLSVDGNIILGPAACVDVSYEMNQEFVDVDSPYSEYTQKVPTITRRYVTLKIDSMVGSDTHELLRTQLMISPDSVFNGEVILTVATEAGRVLYTSHFMAICEIYAPVDYTKRVQHFSVRLEFGQLAISGQYYAVNDAVGDALLKNYYVHIPNPLPNPYDSMVTAIEEERRYEV